MLKKHDDRIKRARSHPPRGSSTGRGRCRVLAISTVCRGASIRPVLRDKRTLSGHRRPVENDLGCVKTPKFNLPIEISSRLHQSKEQMRWRSLSGVDDRENNSAPFSRAHVFTQPRPSTDMATTSYSFRANVVTSWDCGVRPTLSIFPLGETNEFASDICRMRYRGFRSSMMTFDAHGQKQSLNEQLVGTWTLLSWEQKKGDGTKVERYGTSPKGIAFFDAGGRYIITVMRSDPPNTRVMLCGRVPRRKTKKRPTAR